MTDNLLPKEFRERLRNGKYTNWAENLDYSTLQTILWMIGEIANRPTEGMFERFQLKFWGPEHLPSNSNKDRRLWKTNPKLPHPRQSIALETLAEIVSRRHISIDEALHRLHRYPELHDRIATGEIFDVEAERRRIDLQVESGSDK